ncbi:MULTISPECIES: AraC family transcriptional regulator [Pseudomonas]|uniref:Transcriptional regulator, AraC family n=1 Tax=Pseudomonas fluorescens (strain Q2-87) TaxID=1038922 RepID=J2ENF1_PSEFQ|nr:MULTISPECIES: AraC family transcriptional regulator [Pseudomonas]EJL05165.1 transcriptional regulator, AraC family [Pseudomonas fluorescens Q2-87]
MDPLSEVLSLLKPHSYVSAGFAAGGDWSIQFTSYDAIKFNAVITGQCWLIMEGVAAPLLLKEGDCFLLPRGRRFRLASDPALAPIDGATLFPAKRPDGIVTYNGGGDFFLAGSRFSLDGLHADFLLGLLAPIVHIRGNDDQTDLRWSLERMRRELREGQPGGFLIAQHLAHMMLIQALRVHLAQQVTERIGWFYALADKQLGAALSAMHEAPAQAWTLKTLAACAGVSRSTFALKFKAKVGASPMEYLSRWRMLLAAEKLLSSSDSVSTVALSIGYESESAFSTAFKRILGCSPRQYASKATAPA